MGGSLADMRSFKLFRLIQDEHGTTLGSLTHILALWIELLLRCVDLVGIRFGGFEIGVTLLPHGDVKLLRRWIIGRDSKILQVLIVPTLGDPVRFLVLDSHFSTLAEFRTAMGRYTSLLDRSIQFGLLQLLVFHIPSGRFVIWWLLHSTWAAFNHDQGSVVFFWGCYLLDDDIFDRSDLNNA